MRYFTAALAIVATSIWLGGLLTLALLAIAVFKGSGLDRPTAGQATAVMFVWFGKVQLLVAAVALIAAFLGYLQRRARVTMLLFTILAVAAVGAVLFNAIYIPRLESLRLSGQSQSPDFQSLHKQSERLMTAVIVVVFAAALVLPAFCRTLFTDPPRPDSPGA